MTLSALLQLSLNNKWSCNNPFSCSRAKYIISLTFKYWRGLLFSEVLNDVWNAFKSEQSSHFVCSEISCSAAYHACRIQKHSVGGHTVGLLRNLLFTLSYTAWCNFPATSLSQVMNCTAVQQCNSGPTDWDHYQEKGSPAVNTLKCCDCDASRGKFDAPALRWSFYPGSCYSRHMNSEPTWLLSVL